jgi:hypothetical protein
MKRLCGALLLVAACDPGSARPVAKRWTARDFLAKQGDPKADFGGWRPDELLVPVGKPLRFQDGTQAGNPGLTLFPAVADGEVAAFAITDIWADFPQPWVQPAWVPLDSGGARIDGVNTVFPVDVGSTFYSPWWQIEFLIADDVKADTYKSARDVFDTKAKRRPGPLVFCALVPEGTAFADDGTGAKDPMSLRSVAGETPSLRKHLPGPAKESWVDGHETSYLDFGADRAPTDGQNLIEANAYFFVSAAGERPLPLAAVLPADPLRHGLVRRVDVVLPEGAAPFIPSNRGELLTLLQSRGLSVTAAPAALDGFAEFTLRVAVNPSCFTEVGFPSGCDWLDTPERIEALPVASRSVQRVQLSIGVVIP